jgi:metal-responsive CopG/Arc/MetJ family transcriptional regulator
MALGRITVRLDRNLHKRLAQRARDRGTSESDLVREALAAYLAAQGQPETCYDVARRAGLIGVVRDAPGDLSTNRKHFEGFGSR